MFGLLAVIISVVTHLHFLNFHEQREDLVMIYDRYAPSGKGIDMSRRILLTQRLAGIIGLIAAYMDWLDADLYVWLCAFFFTIRTFLIDTIPLHEPRYSIPIEDPLQQLVDYYVNHICAYVKSLLSFQVFHSNERVRMLRHDLMVSGHTGVIALLILASHHWILTSFFFLCSLNIGYGMWRSKIHYTIDIMILIIYLPFLSWCLHVLAFAWLRFLVLLLMWSIQHRYMCGLKI